MKKIMTQEDKELLLKDLCARLPYGVCVYIRYKEGEPCYGKLTPRDIQWFINSNIEVIKPYLRPISSMMEEEKDEFEQIRYNAEAKLFNALSKGGFTLAFHEIDDWLNAHHFDYRGLIGAGLALEAPKEIYNED